MKKDLEIITIKKQKKSFAKVRNIFSLIKIISKKEFNIVQKLIIGRIKLSKKHRNPLQVSLSFRN